MSAFDAQDRAFMARALALAARGLTTAHPNPRVGCVLARDGQVLAEGWHERAGGPHAEAAALANLHSPAAGATAYVTLEPCNHHGRTPPCSEALIQAGVARVVYAIGDPNPQVKGGGAQRLREAGVAVQAGLLEGEASELNAGFIKRMREGLPLVRLKLAMSLDGRIALSDGRSQWISGEAARLDVQQWRARSGAILTGIGTLLADDPQLSVRPPGAQVRQPLRVILDSHLRTPPAARVFEGVTGQSPGVWIFTASTDARRIAALAARGARVEQAGSGGKVDIAQVLTVLGKSGINEVLVEAGATLAGALVEQRRVDELLLYIAPLLLGDAARGLIRLPEPLSLAQAQRFEIFETTAVGADQRMRLRPCSPE